MNVLFFIQSLLLIACGAHGDSNAHTLQLNSDKLLLGIEQMDTYLPSLKNKSLGLIVNHSSHFPNGRHLVDSLLERGVNIAAIFSPEHGFRGTADAGAKIEDGKDAKTGIPIYSLYGKNRKPSAEMLKGIDMLLFDIQDVGTRFYTYISTLEYCMEAAAKESLEFLILDRPNPNGHYVDGPVLEKEYQSFVGRQEIPIIHGLTVGEYALMLRGEKWFPGAEALQLQVIPCRNYSHRTEYILPTAPSPNLPNQRAIYLYPTLCFFEGTSLSVGRGTETPFQILGHPNLAIHSFVFTPQAGEGSAHPKHEDKHCFGVSYVESDLAELRAKNKIDIDLYLSLYEEYMKLDIEQPFFNPNQFIDKLMGTDQLRKGIIAGMSEEEIRAEWEPKLSAFKEMREKYLLYPE